MWKHWINPKISHILDTYNQKIPQGFFVIANFLYFTYENVKYWTIVSSSECETLFIQTICNKLRRLGCSKFAYERGRLD